MAETGSTIGLPQVQAQTRPQPQTSAGSDLAERGYQRLRAGERKTAAALLAQAVATAPNDPRARAWAADRRMLIRRWSGDGYVLVRRNGAPTLLGATPTLGGSQLGQIGRAHV